jgi:hypothetical protein
LNLFNKGRDWVLESRNFSETETLREAKAEYEKVKEMPAHYAKAELANGAQWLDIKTENRRN